MASGIEVAQAYVTIIPSMRGIQGDIANELDADAVGRQAGEEMGGGMGAGLSAKSVVLGNIISDLASKAASEFSERFGDGIEQSDALAKFASTMEFAGFDSKQIEQVRTAMKNYADQTVYDLGEVMDTTAKLAANGTADFETLVQSIGNLNAAAGGDSESFGYLANAITQVNGAGKLMSQDWNQIVNALPGASGAIQNELKEMGAWDDSMGSFKDALAAGEITAEEFNTAVTNLGMSDVAKEAATSSTTFEGAMGQLDASVTNTMQSVYDSLNEDGRVTDAINGMATAFEAISPYVSQFADAIGDLVEFLAPAAPIILGVVAGIAAASGIGAIIGAIASAVTFLTTVVGPALAMVGSIPGLVTLVVGVLGGPITVIGAIVGAIVAFLATNEEARAKVVEVFTSIKETIVTTVTDAADALSRTWTAIKTTVTVVWNSIRTRLSSTVDGIKTSITTKFNALKTFLGSVFNGIKEKLSKPFTDAKNTIKGIISGIKSFFPLNIGNILNIKLPHISVSGGSAPWGIAGKGSLPSFHVNWYAQGGIFNSPSVIGVGEAGSEAVIPIEKLRYYIRDSVPESGGHELLDEVRALRSDVQNVRLYLDSGALVGGISRQMDGSLGRRQQLAGRGVA